MDYAADFQTWELIALAAALIGTGIFAGILAGLLGVGGGIVIVPVLSWLMLLFQLDPSVTQHLAVGTSLATIIPTAISSARSHNRRGSVDWALLKRWAFPMVVGALAGGILSRWASGDALRLVFGIVALIVAVNMAFKVQKVIADGLPGSLAANAFLASGIGLFSSLMGIGGGTLAVPIQTAYNREIRLAVGSASAMGLLIAVPGVLGFIWSGWGEAGLPPLSLGYVSLPAVALIVPATWLCAPVGASIAHKVNQPTLRRLFALFLAITAARMLYSAWA